jgi:hypothetical protein
MTPKHSSPPASFPPSLALALRTLTDRDRRAQRATIATRWLRWLLPLLIALEASLAIIYLWNIAQGHPIAWIDFNARQTLPSWLQASHILALAAVCGWRLLRNESSTPSRLVLRLLVLVLSFAAADEIFKIHLMSHTEVIRHAFFGVYFGAIVTLPVLFWRDLRAVWRLDRGSIWLAAGGLGVFCLGVFASEWIRDVAIAPLWPLLTDRAGGVEYMRIAIEELGELWGETCFLLAALRFEWVTSGGAGRFGRNRDDR